MARMAVEGPVAQSPPTKDTRHIFHGCIEARRENAAVGRHSEFLKGFADDVLTHRDQNHLTWNPLGSLFASIGAGRPPR